MNIAISQTRNVSHIDEILNAIPPSIEEVEISFPVSLSYQDVLAKQQVAFLMATIRQRASVLRLKVFIEELSEELIAKNSLLFASLCLSDSVENATGSIKHDRSQLADLLAASAAIRRKPKQRADGSYYSNASQRIIVYDDFGPSLRPLIFYKVDGELVPVTTFQSRLRAVWTPMRLKGSRDTIDDVSRILWELFENTHQHARVRRNDGLVKRSLRGCLLDYQLGEQMSSTVTDHPVSVFIEDAKGKGATQFLFITIFDSGSGIPDHRRPINEAGTAKSDFDLLAECFNPPVGGLYNRSKGLPTVATILQKMEIPGAAFIRSGSVSAMLDKDGLRRHHDHLEGRMGTAFSVILPYSVDGLRGRT